MERSDPAKHEAVLVAHRRHWSPAVVDSLLEAGRRESIQSTAQALHYFRLALFVALSVPGAQQVPALAELADGLRRQGQLGGARRAWAQVDGRVEAGTEALNPSTEARVCLLRAAYDLRLRETTMAEARLRYALRNSERYQLDETLILQGRLDLGCLLTATGRPEEGFATLVEAARLLRTSDAVRDHVRIDVVEHLVRAALEAGDARTAQIVLSEAEPLLSARPSHYLWMRGLAAAALGHLAIAAEFFEVAIQGLAREGLVHERALAALDLAEVLVRAGRDDELERFLPELQKTLSAELQRRAEVATLLIL